MAGDPENPEAGKQFAPFMTNPALDYCEARFRSLAAELVRMGYKPRMLASVGFGVGLQHSLEDSWEFHDQFRARLGDISQRAADRLAFEKEQAAKAGGPAKPAKPVRY